MLLLWKGNKRIHGQRSLSEETQGQWKPEWFNGCQREWSERDH